MSKSNPENTSVVLRTKRILEIQEYIKNNLDIFTGRREVSRAVKRERLYRVMHENMAAIEKYGDPRD